MFILIFLKNNYNLIIKNIFRNINFKFFSFIALFVFCFVSLFFNILNFIYIKKAEI